MKQSVFLAGYCDVLETNASTKIRNPNFVREELIFWEEDLVFSCQRMNDNPVYLFGPAVLSCRQSTPGEARGSWYKYKQMNFTYVLGNISTTFPECICKDHVYFFKF